LVILVPIKRFIKVELKINYKAMFFGGALTGILSGIAGSAGPVSALLFNSLNLTAGAYIASEAMTALILHIIKIILYKKYLEITLGVIYYGIIIGIAMIIGSFTGKKLVEKIPRKYFQIIIEVCLIASGIQMVIIK
jgi:uncharacterized membrane protein YfcA